MGIKTTLTFKDANNNVVGVQEHTGFFSKEFKRLSTFGNPAVSRPYGIGDVAGLASRLDYSGVQHDGNKVIYEASNITEDPNQYDFTLPMDRVVDPVLQNPVLFEVPGCVSIPNRYTGGTMPNLPVTTLLNIPACSVDAYQYCFGSRITQESAWFGDKIVLIRANNNSELYLVDLAAQKYRYISDDINLENTLSEYAGYGEESPLAYKSSSSEWQSFSVPSGMYIIHPMCYCATAEQGIFLIDSSAIYAYDPVTDTILDDMLLQDVFANQWYPDPQQLAQYLQQSLNNPATWLQMVSMRITLEYATLQIGGAPIAIGNTIVRTDNTYDLYNADPPFAENAAQMTRGSAQYENNSGLVYYMQLAGQATFHDIGDNFFLCRGVYLPYTTTSVGWHCSGYSIIHITNGDGYNQSIVCSLVEDATPIVVPSGATQFDIHSEIGVVG